MRNYRKELKKRGLTLRNFAAKVGISPTYASLILRGKKEPSEEVTEKIYAVMHVCQWCHREWPESIEGAL